MAGELIAVRVMVAMEAVFRKFLLVIMFSS